jgi:hypothetical protein
VQEAVNADLDVEDVVAGFLELGVDLEPGRVPIDLGLAEGMEVDDRAVLAAKTGDMGERAQIGAEPDRAVLRVTDHDSEATVRTDGQITVDLGGDHAVAADGLVPDRLVGSGLVPDRDLPSGAVDPGTSPFAPSTMWSPLPPGSSAMNSATTR